MKKTVTELQVKSVQELEKEAQTLRDEIAKLTIESKVKPEKNTNLSFNKKRRLAVILTLVTQKNLGITK